jgi:hypothetical protein
MAAASSPAGKSALRYRNAWACFCACDSPAAARVLAAFRAGPPAPFDAESSTAERPLSAPACAFTRRCVAPCQSCGASSTPSVFSMSRICLQSCLRMRWSTHWHLRLLSLSSTL